MSKKHNIQKEDFLFWFEDNNKNAGLGALCIEKLYDEPSYSITIDTLLSICDEIPSSITDYKGEEIEFEPYECRII